MYNNKKVITKPALTSPKIDREVSYLFKKYNFAVNILNSKFKVFSYEANYEKDNNEDYVHIKVKDATTNKVVKVFSVSVDSICSLNEINYCKVVAYEEFCSLLFNVIVEAISNDEDLL